jgi:glyoxylase-like metal-dependent hydrolase (beta-lactamase superfamily II)
MDAPYQGSSDVHVFPANLPLPGIGVLPINAYLVMAEQPVLVDTGIGFDSDQFLDAVSSVVPLDQIRWVWLTHDDADHTGSIQRVMELAPNATLVTHAMSALRMSSWWEVPLHRVHAIRFGDELHVGDRTLTAVAPPLFDNPMSTGFLDQSTGALFTVDAFGAILPEATQDAADVPPEALAGGMVGWAASDSPWVHVTDRAMFGQVLERVRQLRPSRIFSSHLPAASGTSMDEFVKILETVPDSEPFMPPSAEEFGHLIDALTAAQQAGGVPGQRSVEPAGSALPS